MAGGLVGRRVGAYVTIGTLLSTSTFPTDTEHTLTLTLSPTSARMPLEIKIYLFDCYRIYEISIDTGNSIVHGCPVQAAITDNFACFQFFSLGKLSYKKNGKKGDMVPFWRPPLPKRVKRGHLLSDYRQKCVNGTGDILMLKACKMTILAIIMF